MLVDEIETLRRHVEQIHNDQRRGIVTAAVRMLPIADATSNKKVLAAHSARVQRLLQQLEFEVSQEAPTLLSTIGYLRVEVQSLLAAGFTSAERGDALLDAVRSSQADSAGDQAWWHH